MCDSFNKVVLKISVIIAVYDGVDSIENAINSVLKQNYSAIELLVIDGGSKDGTLEVIEKYLDHISFFETGQDSGISDAFKKGQQVNYVLGEWDEEEKAKLSERLDTSSEAIKSFVLSGLPNTMSSFNGK